MKSKKKEEIVSKKTVKKGDKDVDKKVKISKNLVVKGVKKTPPKRKKKVKETGAEPQPLDKYGPFCNAFILEHIRNIDYTDIAKLIGIKSSDLKEAIEKMGIKLPIDRARKWTDIDVGKFMSLSDCSRCQVQLYHSSFYVGINNCKKCYEKNIKHWIGKKIPIILKFTTE